MHAVRGSAWAAAISLVWLVCLAWTTGVQAQQPAQEQTEEQPQQPVQQPAGILVLSVSQEGKYDSHLTRALQDHLDRAGEKIIKTEISQTDRRCGDPNCLAKLGEQVPAALIVGERVQATGERSYNVTAWLYEVVTRTPIGRQEHCGSCSPQQLETRVKELADKLLIEQRARAAMSAPQPPEPPQQDEPPKPTLPQQPSPAMPSQPTPSSAQQPPTQPTQTGPVQPQAQQPPTSDKDQDKQPPDLSSLPEESSEAAPQQEVPNPPSPILPVPVPDDHPRPTVRRPLPVWRKVLGGVLGGLTAASLVGGITWAAMDGGPTGGGPCSYMGLSGNFRCVWDTKTNYIAGFVLAGAFGVGMGLVLGLPTAAQGDKP